MQMQGEYRGGTWFCARARANLSGLGPLWTGGTVHMPPPLCFTQGDMFEFELFSRTWLHLYPWMQMRPGKGTEVKLKHVTLVKSQGMA